MNDASSKTKPSLKDEFVAKANAVRTANEEYQALIKAVEEKIHRVFSLVGDLGRTLTNEELLEVQDILDELYAPGAEEALQHEISFRNAAGFSSNSTLLMHAISSRKPEIVEMIAERYPHKVNQEIRNNTTIIDVMTTMEWLRRNVGEENFDRMLTALEKAGAKTYEGLQAEKAEALTRRR